VSIKIEENRAKGIVGIAPLKWSILNDPAITGCYFALNIFKKYEIIYADLLAFSNIRNS